MTVDPVDARFAVACDLVSRVKYGAALPVLRELASAGHWQVHALIGDLLYRGAPDLPRDPGAAIAAYRKAVFEGDDAHAHLGLGRILLRGDDGVETDLASAEGHLRRAVAGGESVADMWLGELLVRKHRAGGDLGEAEVRLRPYAAKGYLNALFCLGEIDRARGRSLAAAWKKLRCIFLAVRALRRDPDSPLLEGMVFPRDKAPRGNVIALSRPSRPSRPRP